MRLTIGGIEEIKRWAKSIQTIRLGRIITTPSVREPRHLVQNRAATREGV